MGTSLLFSLKLYIPPLSRYDHVAYHVSTVAHIPILLTKITAAQNEVALSYIVIRNNQE